jgi:hypothetical protein
MTLLQSVAGFLRTIAKREPAPLRERHAAAPERRRAGFGGGATFDLFAAD